MQGCIKIKNGSQRDGSWVAGPSFSCRGTEVCFQHPSQTMPSTLHFPLTSMSFCTPVFILHTNTYNEKENKSFKKGISFWHRVSTCEYCMHVCEGSQIVAMNSGDTMGRSSGLKCWVLLYSPGSYKHSLLGEVCVWQRSVTCMYSLDKTLHISRPEFARRLGLQLLPSKYITLQLFQTAPPFAQWQWGGCGSLFL